MIQSHLPQGNEPVDVGMVKEEDWVKGSRLMEDVICSY